MKLFNAFNYNIFIFTRKKLTLSFTTSTDVIYHAIFCEIQSFKVGRFEIVLYIITFTTIFVINLPMY